MTRPVAAGDRSGRWAGGRKSAAERTPGLAKAELVHACSGCPLFAGGSIVDPVARLAVRRSLAVGMAVFAVFTAWPGCTTVDPGSNFVIADQTFNANYFYCYVEPQLIFAKQCGSGDATDPPNGCHYNSSAVSGMALIQHPAIDCGGGSAPLDATQVGAGSPAESNLQECLSR